MSYNAGMYDVAVIGAGHADKGAGHARKNGAGRALCPDRHTL